MNASPDIPAGAPKAGADRTPKARRAPKNPTAAWLLWVFLGVFGAHRYYLGDWKMALPMTLTLGGLGIWSLIDGIFLGRRIHRINTGQL